MTHVHAPELYVRKLPAQRTRHDSHIRMASAIRVCPAIIASVLGVSEGYVLQRQRKLGLRKCTYAPRKKEKIE